MPRLAIGVLVAFLAGCAAPRMPPPEREPPPRPRLFISPAGEPFRLGPQGDEPMRTWFEAADGDRDGALVFAEFLEDHQRFFRIADADGDGVIGDADVRNYERSIAPEILSVLDRGDPEPGEARPRGGRMGGPGGGGRGSPGGGRGGPGMGPPRGGAGPAGRPGAARFSLINEPQPLRAADANLDYRVTPAEWAAAARVRFDELDADSDGRLAFVELRMPGAPRLPGRR